MDHKDSFSRFLKVVGGVTIFVGLPTLAILAVSKVAESVNRFSSKLTPHDPVVRSTAVRIARQSPGTFNIHQAFAIFDWIKRNIPYVSDPSDGDYIAPPRETLERSLGGDCDDHAVLAASMIKAIGGSARVAVVYLPTVPSKAHAFAELLVGPKGSVHQMLPAIQGHYMTAQQQPIHWENDNAGGEWLIFDTLLEYPGALPMHAGEVGNAWKWPQGSRIEYHY